MYERERFELFCKENYILIHFVGNLSTTVKGYCYYDGFYYNVVLNNKLCSNQLKLTTIHEITHVMENHFLQSNENLFSIESFTKQRVKEFELVYF